MYCDVKSGGWLLGARASDRKKQQGRVCGLWASSERDTKVGSETRWVMDNNLWNREIRKAFPPSPFKDISSFLHWLCRLPVVLIFT